MRNVYRVENDITYVTLASQRYGEQEVSINTEDISLISQYDIWYLHKGGYTFYAIYQPTNSGKQQGFHTAILMHRLILGNPVGKWVDHWDHNGLNNIRSNIFIVTPRQNFHNRTDNRVYRGSKPLDGKFITNINIGGKKITLTMVKTEKQSGFCYNMVCMALGDINIHNIILTDEEKESLLSQLRNSLQKRKKFYRNPISLWIIRGLIIFLKYNNFEKFTEYVLYAKSLVG